MDDERRNASAAEEMMREGVPELQKTEGILAEDLAAEDLSRRPQQKTARWLQDLRRRLKPSCRRLICTRLNPS
jgi:hypothetical protein